jgi:hypothetical protein
MRGAREGWAFPSASDGDFGELLRGALEADD